MSWNFGPFKVLGRDKRKTAWTLQEDHLDLREYERRGRNTYELLCKVVRDLLSDVIGQKGDYRLQLIQCRAKSVESLAARLEESGEADCGRIWLLRKDLAGCRIVFHTNNDVNRFIRSDIMDDHFEIDWSKTRIHHPDFDAPGATRLFQSFNYAVTLKSGSAALRRHPHLEGLSCEVQVQTVLNHVWAELEHDTVYKRPKGEGIRES